MKLKKRKKEAAVLQAVVFVVVTVAVSVAVILSEVSAVAIGVVRAAVACHDGMATFDEAGVSDKD